MCGRYSLVRKSAFIGVMQLWSNGVLVKPACSTPFSLPPYSNTPLLHPCSILHFQEQHGNFHSMPHFVGCRTVENIADESMAVRRHCDKIDIFVAGELDDFIGRLSESEKGITLKAFFGHFAPAFFQIGAVLFHFLTLG